MNHWRFQHFLPIRIPFPLFDATLLLAACLHNSDRAMVIRRNSAGGRRVGRRRTWRKTGAAAKTTLSAVITPAQFQTEISNRPALFVARHASSTFCPQIKRQMSPAFQMNIISNCNTIPQIDVCVRCVLLIECQIGYSNSRQRSKNGQANLGR